MYNWVHNKVIAVTSATTTTVLGNVKVAMLVLFSRVLFGETKDWQGIRPTIPPFTSHRSRTAASTRLDSTPFSSASGLSKHPPITYG